MLDMILFFLFIFTNNLVYGVIPSNPPCHTKIYTQYYNGCGDTMNTLFHPSTFGINVYKNPCERIETNQIFRKKLIN